MAVWSPACLFLFMPAPIGLKRSSSLGRRDRRLRPRRDQTSAEPPSQGTTAPVV